MSEQATYTEHIYQEYSCGSFVDPLHQCEEIVRCRDCIWYRPFPGIQITYGICKKTHLEVDDNGFCVWAERWE